MASTPTSSTNSNNSTAQTPHQEIAKENGVGDVQQKKTNVIDPFEKITIDKSWITNRNRLSQEYRDGVKQFINLARSSSPGCIDTRCPCRRCGNMKFQTFGVVDSHLYQYGFTASYTQWVHHGESRTLPFNFARVDNRVSNDRVDRGSEEFQSKASRSLHTIPHVSGSKSIIRHRWEMEQKCEDVSDPFVYAQSYKRRNESWSADRACDIHKCLVDIAAQPIPNETPRQPGEVIVQVLDVPKKGGYVRELGHGGLGFVSPQTSLIEKLSAVQRENEELRHIVLQMQQREAEREKREVERERREAEWEQRLRQIEDLLQTQGRMPHDSPTSDEW